jgi:hypothetical protein
MEDDTRLHRDDMPMLQVQSFLVGSYILALPIDGSTCLGSTKTKARYCYEYSRCIGVDGDHSVSHFTSFALSFEGHRH